MRRRLSSTFVLVLAAASCSSPEAGIKVRAASSGPEVTSVAEAEGQLALGNAGLALEGFRAALRQQPGNVRALTGMAHCYEQMGRFDLSRKWYELALAAAPESRTVLADFAGSLEIQGKTKEALLVRAEAKQVAQAQSESPASPEAVSAGNSPMAATVTLTLPAPAPPAREAEAKDERQVSNAKRPAPRLERLSLGEVALITGDAPVWHAKLVSRTPQSATFRFVEARPVARLLNAARIEGLAARTRAHLVERGWKDIAIGDAPAVRQETLILFPSSREAMARRLASQFRFGRLHEFEGRDIIVLLGRDSVRSATSRPA